ncbi:thioredoxin family protein [Aestuariivita sp.]|jgi:thiol-disulfide isomerase/thioredoxin|uniref:thioredoxin family protein n=1 Tax=Aestuariivita sp. TaxID=1872407 RepID=UPI0025C5B2F7|nr:thioredoxin family protein [Aestuariivita sp.]|eukprot:TRINITY_DN26558_c0_g1_i1.p1 TRINITY_DN26558_c0_g1~~TRINITY_DN26558_c0_g1_i1.p1  ORF type:complete len:135 (+),score=1.35 TRINITY_DN26558_c0_g1_i1:3-407(+)
MNRRQLLCLGAAALILPGSAHASYEATPYVWGMRSTLRDTGQTVIYNFRSSWSLTCQIKEEILAELKDENPDYRALIFVDVDFDTYGPSQWVERLKVRRRSTLVVIKGEAEIARIENQPYKERLRNLLDTAMAV